MDGPTKLFTHSASLLVQIFTKPKIYELYYSEILVAYYIF